MPTYVECNELVFATSEVIFGDTINKQSTDSIMLECESFAINFEAGNNPSLITYLSEDKIGIIAENDPPYPFYSYISEPEESLELSKELEPKYRILRRIILSFRSHSKGVLARFKDKIEHRRVLKDESGQKILEKLINKGILYQDGQMYCINPGKLDQFLKINYHDLKKKKVTAKILYFLKYE